MIEASSMDATSGERTLVGPLLSRADAGFGGVRWNVRGGRTGGVVGVGTVRVGGA